MRVATATASRHRVWQVNDTAARYGDLRPADFAAELATEYSRTVPEERRREFAQFFTPPTLARFMAALARPTRTARRLLDPGAGTGVLASALCERLPKGMGQVHLDAYEFDPCLADRCEESLAHTQRWLTRRGVDLSFAVHRRDFILETAAVIDPHTSLFLRPALPTPYNVAISNPPYFKLSKDDPRAVAAASVVHGQPNIYALFMAVAAGLLADRGVMVTITPRSFTTGDYFRRFRQHLFSTVRPEVVHLFHSRKDAFRKDEVLQENVILRARRQQPADNRPVVVSTSAGLADLRRRQVRHVPPSTIVDPQSRNAVFHIPADDTDDETLRFVRSWPSTLHGHGLEVSTGPVVAFRATEFLRASQDDTAGVAPLLWLKHVRAMQIQWPLSKSQKPEHIIDSEASRYLLIRNGTYVVMRRFTAKEDHRRLTASPLQQGQLPGRYVGLENHLNYIHRPGGTLSDDEAIGLAALFNSALLDRYFRVSNGNTQVNAGELRTLPLPSRQSIIALGTAVGRSATLGLIDEVVARVLRLPASLHAQLTTSGYAEG
jgi:adenine-specific DNA-methyltransferase